ncbi:MAG: SDR family NAD(P)-dependent oxidoreductase [Eubacteriales bacterium]|nr:SDR family NAD(P)-dependent oxidoreductase [Eubacteriales bacterium]
MSLEKRVVVITGGTGGMGKALVKSFLENGAAVAFLDIDEECLAAEEAVLKACYSDVMGLFADVTSAASVKAAVDKVIRGFGRIDVLITCAGILQDTPLEEISEEEWDRVFSVNMKGTFLCCQAVIPYMKERGTGRIVTISSNAGRDGGLATGLAYSSSKSGVIGLTRGLARRLAPYGISCNCIAPGPTDTEMMRTHDETTFKHILSSIPLKKMARAKDIAELAVFIASEYGDFMTGAVVDINGGLFIG